jgi:hypothetical protein
MRELAVAMISGVAALVLKVHLERDSLAFSWASLKILLFPIAVATAVFITWDVIRAARLLISEVKAESEQEIDLYPSLVLPERFTARRTPAHYRLKITGMASFLIATCLLLCLLSWGGSNASKPTTATEVTSLSSGTAPTATVTPTVRAIQSPLASATPTATATPALIVTTAVPTPTTSARLDVRAAETPSGPSPTTAPTPTSSRFHYFLVEFPRLHSGYKTYSVLDPQFEENLSKYYVRLGRLGSGEVSLLIYVTEWPSTRQVVLSVINGYDRILEDLKGKMKEDGVEMVGVVVSHKIVVYVVGPRALINRLLPFQEAKEKGFDLLIQWAVMGDENR